MSRGIPSLGIAGHVPMNALSIGQAFELELGDYLTAVRREANAQRQRSDSDRHYYYGHLRYLVGHLHGLVFGFHTLLLFHSGEYTRCSDLAAAAMNEADFLTGTYIHGDVQ